MNNCLQGRSYDKSVGYFGFTSQIYGFLTVRTNKKLFF